MEDKIIEEANKRGKDVDTDAIIWGRKNKGKELKNQEKKSESELKESKTAEEIKLGNLLGDDVKVIE